ncbi:MAG: hypothetical protein KC635_20945, partial [Myxococcales bacterium]|nr:hypothetical protein [Myxococcales bacterium]
MGSVTDWLEGHDVDDVVSSLVFARGRDLWIKGHAVSVRQRLDGILEAQIKGSKDALYDVTVVASRAQLVARCTCPFEAMVCKHVVCALLAWKEEVRKKHDAELDAADDASGATPAALDRKTSRAAVFAWARERGVEHWLSASPAFVPQLRLAAKPASAELLRARMLQIVDFFGRDSRWSHISDTVVDHLVGFLDERARAVADHRPKDARRRWTPASDDVALERAVGALVALRASLREDTAGREPAARTTTSVTLIPWPPGLSVHFRAHPMVAGLGITTLAPLWGEHTVRLRFGDDGVELVDPDGTPGELLVEAVEAALDALCDPADQALAHALRDELAKPLWRRMLETMRREMTAVSPAPLSHGQEEGELGWRVAVSRYDLNVAPVFVRPKKTGSGWILRKLSLGKLTQTPRRWDHPGDAPALAALESGAPRASYAALQHLVGHPRIFSAEGEAR